MQNKKVYIETYGCQMNVSDSEIVASVLGANGYEMIGEAGSADVILLNTCSVRENAERKIFERLTHLKQYSKKKNNLVVGVLGCMAERVKEKLLEEREIVSVVVGPDEYRRIPEILSGAFQKEKGIAVALSEVETYEDIEPLRTEGVSAWLSIMRGCNNFCAYCVVPYTRGRERSRSFGSIMAEVQKLSADGFREITLLGQNVNSYKFGDITFPMLLSSIAESVPDMRIRFVTSHPKDLSNELIDVIATHSNVCKYLHLPLQSGSDRILSLMKRKYTLAHYMERIAKIREAIPGIALSTDIIAGFPGETEDDHKATLQAMKEIGYEGAFMFRYSPREGTKAYELEDDVPEDVKIRRLNEIIDQQQGIAKQKNKEEIGRILEVLAEQPSRRKAEDWQGRSDTNKTVIFPNTNNTKAGDLVTVKILRSTAATLFGELQH